MDDSKKEVMISEETKSNSYAKDTAETVKQVYETAKNYTGVGKAACETVEGLVKSTGLVEATGLEKHIPAAIDGIDNRINKLFSSETFSITKRLQDYQEFFLSQLPEEYYQLVKDKLLLLQENIQLLQKMIKENAPKSQEDMKLLFNQAVAKSNELINAILAIPGNDVFKSLPTSVSGAVEYLKATPTMLKSNSGQMMDQEQIRALINKLNELVDSVTEVFGKAWSKIIPATTNNITTATSETTTTTTSETTTTTTTTFSNIATPSTTEEGRLC